MNFADESAGMFNLWIRKSIDHRVGDCPLFFSFPKYQSLPIMKRRHFLQVSLASAITMPAFALNKDNPCRKNIGIQLYTLRNQSFQYLKSL